MLRQEGVKYLTWLYKIYSQSQYSPGQYLAVFQNELKRWKKKSTISQNMTKATAEYSAATYHIIIQGLFYFYINFIPSDNVQKETKNQFT